MDEQFATTPGGIDLCYETFGDPADQAMLLVMGLGMQMLGWRDDFCRRLAERGFFVIRYDNRDAGRSTHHRGVRPPNPLELLTRRPRELAYTLEDLADDGVALLDHLGIERAHVAGASMGGMIAQTMAARHPGRVLSLTSIMSTTGSRRVGNPALRLYPIFLGRPPRSRDAYVERAEKVFRLIGSPGFETDLEEVRRVAALSYERDPSASGTPRQLAAILAGGDRAAELRRIEAPTLVIHGSADRLIAPSGGRATAKAIPGAKLMTIDGMGHDLPRELWDRLVDAIAANAARTREADRAGA